MVIDLILAPPARYTNIPNAYAVTAEMLTMELQWWFLNVSNWLWSSTFTDVCEDLYLFLLLQSCDSSATIILKLKENICTICK